MRRTAQTWALIAPVPGDVVSTTIAWRTGLTEIQVFGVDTAGRAEPVGDRPAWTYR